jgi:hypothetical protein
MNAIPNESVNWVEDTEVVRETQDGLVEVGAVSETKGSPVGFFSDAGGNGFTFA